MSSDHLPIERDESGEFAGIVTVRLHQEGRPVVVLDHDLIQRLEMTLKHVPHDATGLMLASSSDRVFVAGADLKTVQDEDDNRLHKYLQYGARVFGMLSSFPFPTVAAINGAALGGGLELAMHCDGLVGAPGAKPYPIGLPEAGLSICPGWGGTNLLPARMDPCEAILRTATGKPFTFDEARSQNLFDEVARSQDALTETAKQWLVGQRTGEKIKRDGAPLKWIGRPELAPEVLDGLDAVRPELPDTGAASAVAEAVETGLSKGWEAALEVERARLVQLRASPEGRAAIKAFFEKSASKS